MAESIGRKSAHLHPLLGAIKRNWAKLFERHEIKQWVIADQVGVDRTRVSRWVNVNEHDFPEPPNMAKFIEAMQEWPGVEPHEPIQALCRYFQCEAVSHDNKGPLDITPSNLGDAFAWFSVHLGRLNAEAFQILADGEISHDEEHRIIAMLPEVENTIQRFIDLRDRILACSKRHDEVSA